MVSHPEKWVDDFAKAGASLYCFHIEATQDASALIDQIHAAGMKAGVAVKPKTPISTCMPKVAELRARYPNLDIEVDGGIARENIDAAAQAGANVIVAGTSIFKADDISGTIESFRAT
ncbi:RIBULOSE-phosphate 3-epimerase, partial [Podila verticillata]